MRLERSRNLDEFTAVTGYHRTNSLQVEAFQTERNVNVAFARGVV